MRRRPTRSTRLSPAFPTRRSSDLFPLVGLHPLAAGILSFVILDFAVWLEHVASHKLPLFWRIHRMHHADNGFDVTTGIRFHPLRSEEHTSELQSLMRISYAVFCLKKKIKCT